MSYRVYKYPIPMEDSFELDLPFGARPLHVDVQRGVPCLWALVNTTAPTAPRRFLLRGTGHDIDKPESFLSHCGTFQLSSGVLVFHLFEVLG